MEALPAADLNAQIAGLLRDLAAIQAVKAKSFGYKRAASAVFWLPRQIDQLREDGAWPKIPGLGPASMRVVAEVVATGESPTVERAVAGSGKQIDIDRRRSLRQRFLSRAEVLRVLSDPAIDGIERSAYRADFQMHSEWSDGAVPLSVLARACAARGYTHSAITDHAKGLPIAGGLSMASVAAQHEEIDRLNAEHSDFYVLKGIEANISADGALDLDDEERAAFDLVLAAPHSKLRIAADQTDRLLRVLDTPNVHILAHPRGRIMGTRAGVMADWDRVFARAAERLVAIEIDGDPARQDLDYELAARARVAGCIFALDSDAHAPDQLVYAETAIAHARLAGIPASRIVNCWPLEKLRAWMRGLGSR
ncbi:MAG TPA: PHP domain-containing protein [Vicinamibacterales bacterium]|nr:PHP domain-containing protein [Vicinamibacterales bacterium]